ncbi:EAL domain-containing protein [Leptospira kanakyensis]|uniref:EAL domain-containing protein n=1 Tax=Leptospira kanakyensis TaxID=2484968 RepID=A0A6N4Q472_9LEPT|nr:EAL domain-containing protein [Leptospira kanakyensis]MCW7469002.1 EAL domain-containing protein [Leptospira kanakyensis]MCW7479989.1 EAL domain-containing protein [Leptospira kanakyensis]TGK50212.1 EAL domain-containing protein [Leptospira kanakyensis]TGK64188.1 EAL domain-containing protein [Leptospira kanakyensis]TGK69350.1 EAL domain-containing protein [Leptospira kanakyensis]
MEQTLDLGMDVFQLPRYWEEYQSLETIYWNGSFASEYQPIVSILEKKTVAYEALARFYTNGGKIAPDRAFQILHNDPGFFFDFEKKLKNFQIQNRPEGYPLFLNMDAHVYSKEIHSDHWESVFKKEKNIVCELIENTDYASVEDSKFCMNHLKEMNIPFALDDIGGKNNLFCFEFLEGASYLKFDRRWLSLLRTDKNYSEILKGFLAFAKLQKIQCILEGIETQADLEIATKTGFDLGQGFLFKYGTLQAVA